MISRREVLAGSAAVLFNSLPAVSQTQAARVTVVLDAFGRPSNLKRGWGYSAFIEYGGRRFLFDTGSRSADFAHNISALSIDLKRLDGVLLSHRHADHTAGLSHVLSENPEVNIFAPFEGAQFNTPIPPGLTNLIRRYVAEVPQDLRYFGGSTEGDYRPEATWSAARFRNINQPTEVMPGFTVFSTRSETPGTREMNEISLMLKTSRGSILFVGCSHPGIEKIVEAATQIDPKIYSIFGGFHLVDMPDDQVTAMVTRLKDKWGIERMAAGHCTGQFAFAEIIRIYGEKFDYSGVGATVALPA